jgi:hypothetical protein
MSPDEYIWRHRRSVVESNEYRSSTFVERTLHKEEARCMREIKVPLPSIRISNLRPCRLQSSTLAFVGSLGCQSCCNAEANQVACADSVKCRQANCLVSYLSADAKIMREFETSVCSIRQKMHARSKFRESTPPRRRCDAAPYDCACSDRGAQK